MYHPQMDRYETDQHIRTIEFKHGVYINFQLQMAQLQNKNMAGKREKKLQPRIIPCIDRMLSIEGLDLTNEKQKRVTGPHPLTCHWESSKEQKI